MRGFIQDIGLEGTDNASKKHSKVGVSGCIPLQEMLLSQSVLVQLSFAASSAIASNYCAGFKGHHAQ